MKVYNQLGEEVTPPVYGWSVDIGKGTERELKTLMELLYKFEPQKIHSGGTYYSMERARNDFFYKLRKEDHTKEELIKLFEEIFGVSAANFDQAKVFRQEEYDTIKKTIYVKD